MEMMSEELLASARHMNDKTDELIAESVEKEENNAIIGQVIIVAVIIFVAAIIISQM